MKSRALALLSISGLALAACSGGPSNPSGGASEAGSDLSRTTDPASGALLDVAEAQSHGWALSRPPSGAVTVKPSAREAAFHRVARATATDVAGTGLPESERLQIQKDGVRYASGKTMFGPGGSGTIEELPLRAHTIRSANARGSVKEQGNDGSDPDVTPGAVTTGLSATDGKLFYSAQVTEDGLVFKIAGNAIYYDFQRRFDMGANKDAWYGLGSDGLSGTADDSCYGSLVAATADCTNWIHHDVRVTFGRPSPAPHGHHAWYWNTRIPLPTGTSANDDNIKAAWDRSYIEARDLGSYELWMTNLARIDKNLENAEGPPYTTDDEEQFLSHAAYGLLLYNDNIASYKTVGRLTGYHFGYDAFADSADVRTTDIENAVSATFRGTTMAQMVMNLTGGHPSQPLRVDLRGDIELSASIGGSGGGTISGVISGFEMLGPDGTWHPHAAIIDPKKQERLVLASATGSATTNYWNQQTNGVFTSAAATYASYGATINADGSYEGGVYLQYYDDSDSRWKDKTDKFDTTVTTSFTKTDDGGTTTRYPGASQFGGRFYGPVGDDDDLSGLETAGHWFLSADAACTENSCDSTLLRTGPVYGSFGATQ